MAIVSTHKAFLIKLFQEPYRHFYTGFFFGITVIDVGLVTELELEDSKILITSKDISNSFTEPICCLNKLCFST